MNAIVCPPVCFFYFFLLTPSIPGYIPLETHKLAGQSSPIGYLSHHHHHLSLNREGRWGTTDDFTTSFLQLSLFCTAPWDFANSRPVLSVMLSSHHFLCLPCLLPLFTLPCKMVLARPDERETCPCHYSLRSLRWS